MRPIEPALGPGVTLESHAVDAADLALSMVANFRAHPHVCNIMTHISGGNWKKVEKALVVILDPEHADTKLSKLAENIVELICAEQGVTGRILKPFFAQLLATYLPAEAARAVAVHIEALFARMNEPEMIQAPVEAVVAAEPQWILVTRQREAKSLAFCA